MPSTDVCDGTRRVTPISPPAQFPGRAEAVDTIWKVARFIPYERLGR